MAVQAQSVIQLQGKPMKSVLCNKRNQNSQILNAASFSLQCITLVVKKKMIKNTKAGQWPTLLYYEYTITKRSDIYTETVKL